MHAHGEYGHGAAVAVVGGIPDELIVKTHVQLRQDSQAVVTLDNLLRSRMRQPMPFHSPMTPVSSASSPRPTTTIELSSW